MWMGESAATIVAQLLGVVLGLIMVAGGIAAHGRRVHHDVLPRVIIQVYLVV